MALKAGLARYQGSCSFYGSAKVVPGCIIELKGLGKRFNGNLFVGSVTHTIENNEWMTEAGAGVSSLNITDEMDVVSPSASGFLPGLQGLHAAVVRKLDGDPLKEYRIQIELPWMDGKNKLLWARLSTMYATNASGNFSSRTLGAQQLPDPALGRLGRASQLGGDRAHRRLVGPGPDQLLIVPVEGVRRSLIGGGEGVHQQLVPLRLPGAPLQPLVEVVLADPHPVQGVGQDAGHLGGLGRLIGGLDQPLNGDQSNKSSDIVAFVQEGRAVEL